MTPDEYCQDKAAKSGSSFYYSFLFLPPERRRAITALYAFCREVDDVVDECTDPSLARVKLAWWRADRPDVRRQARAPVTLALRPHLQSCSITRERLLAVVDGMEMDLDQTRYLDWPGLRKYCWHAAGVVGELSAGVFGYSDPRTLVYAEAGPGVPDDQHHPRRGRRRPPRPHLHPGQRHAAVRGQGLGHPQWRILRALLGADEVPGRPRPRAVPRGHAQPARGRPARAAAGPDDGGHLSRAARRDRARQLAGAAPAHFADALRKLWLAWKTWVGGGRGLVRRLAR